MKRFWTVCVPGLLLLPGLAHATDFRCGTQLVTEADTRATVLDKCGEPASKQMRVIWLRDIPRGRGVLPLPNRRVVEEWTYNRGRNQFIQLVRFEGDRFVEVLNGGYGW